MLNLTHEAAVAASLPPGCRAVSPRAGDAPASPAAMLYCPSRDARPAPYYLQLPQVGAEGAPVLVVVHGISRNAGEQLRAFGAQAARLGLVTVAPRFSRRRFPAYQRLGQSRRGLRSLPDAALESILDEVAASTGADSGRVFLFGFSGGAQFAHRYAMRRPQRVRSLALGSAGWYTFPNVDAPFPRGIGATPLASGMDPLRFLAIPSLVLVGERDTRRDGAFNTETALDQQQGRNRVERARRWREAMQLAAARAGITPRFELEIMPRCGHDFGACVARGELVQRVLQFVVATTRRPRPREAAGPALLVSLRD